MWPPNVYLVGFMGAGKTEVGRRLAVLLDRPFLDLDELIEKRAGRTIRELFEQHGEGFFRRLEEEELERLSSVKEAVVALGGGAFCRAKNLLIIRQTGVSVWLDAPADVLYRRCEGGLTRPLLAGRRQFGRLLKSRLSCYSRASIRVDASGPDIGAVAADVIAELERFRGREGAKGPSDGFPVE